MSNDFPEITNEPWRREWLSLEEWQEHPGWDDGFVGRSGSKVSNLAAMNARFGNRKGPKPQSLQQVFCDTSSSRAVVLLGRPDAGKSHELRRFHREMPDSVLIEAKDIGEALPQHLDRVVGKEVSSKPLTLIFDSLDEASIDQPKTLGSIFLWLRQRDKNHGNGATRLVLSCRWADWPESALRSAVQQWAGQNPATLVLLPLGVDDAQATAAWVLKEKARPFWEELHERNLGWLACWPRAFITMMRTWFSDGSLPASPRLLINRFVDESLLVTTRPDEILRQSRNPEDGRWMKRVAGRVAAAMFFCGKSAFTLDCGSSPEWFSFLDLRGDEKWNLLLRSVTDEDIRNLSYRTSLMRPGLGSPRFIFHSQVVQETLAAGWLAAQQLPVKRLVHLFSRTELGIFPQLRPLAAALAEQHAEFRKWVLNHDPVVLLLADHSGLENPAKQEIVSALLEYTKRVQVVDRSVWQGHLGTLAYPGLLDQLRPWLSDPATPSAVMQVALEIANKAKPEGTAEMLWDTLPFWQGGLRSNLARAITNSAPEEITPEWAARWRSVIDGETPTDNEGVLIYYALKYLVPSHVPVREALDWLVLERQFRSMGIYSFFHWNAGEHVTLEDVPAILKYMARERVFYLDHTDDVGPFGREKGVAIRTLSLAFHHLEVPAIRDALEYYWVEYMTRTNFGCQISLPGLTNWTGKFSLTENSRRSFALGFLTKYQCPFSEAMYDEFECFLLDRESDGPWLLGLIPAASGTLASNLPQVARRLFDWAKFRKDHPERLLRAWKSSSYLQQILPASGGEESPLPELDRRQEDYDRAQAEQKSQREAKLAKESFQREAAWKEELATMESQLKDSHQRNHLIWPEVYRFLLLSQKGRYGGVVSHQHAVAPSTPSAWITDAARRFLLETPESPVNRDHGMAAQFALTWLGPASFSDETLMAKLGGIWLPWIVNAEYDGHPDWMPRRLEWLEHFPSAELTVFAKILLVRYLGQDGMTFLKSWSERWTASHTKELVKLLVENPIQPEGAGQAWFFLAEQDFAEARGVMEFWLGQLPPPASELHPQPGRGSGITIAHSEGLREMSRSQGTTRELVWGLAFACCRGLFWDKLRETAASQDEFVKRCLHAVQHAWSRWEFFSGQTDRMDWARPKDWASDSALASFAEIIWKLFPRAERHHSDYPGARAVTWQDDLITMRHAVVEEAQRRGLVITPPPEDHSLIPLLRHGADQHRLAQEWHPFKAADFFQSATQLEARLARDNGQLLECVLDALDLWEIEVQSRAGQWHLRDSPMDEYLEEPIISKRLKDWLKSHMKIIGSAESQPFQRSGERLDVLLEWPIPQWNQVLSLIIEVKKNTYRSGSKNVRTEIEPQLLQGYLEPQHRLDKSITHGLYLVIWVTGHRTDDKISAKINKLRSDLAAQARKISYPPFLIESRVIDARSV